MEVRPIETDLESFETIQWCRAGKESERGSVKKEKGAGRQGIMMKANANQKSG